MKQMVCEMCGGKKLVKQDGVFVCQNCQTKYSVEEAKKMIVEEAKQNNNTSISGILGAIVVVLVMALIIFVISNAGPEQVGDMTEKMVEKAVESTKANLKNYRVADIKYEFTGTASSVNLTLTNQDGGIEQYNNVKVPGFREFSVSIKRGMANYYHASLMAQNNGSRGDVTVTIYVNGKKFRTATSRGAYAIASADGAVEYKDVEE
jgi:hypothetical protein